jgi:hypothetical protein
MKALALFLLFAHADGRAPNRVDTFRTSQECAAQADALNQFYTRTHIKYECAITVRKPS